MVLSSGSMIVAGPQLASQLALAAAFNQKCWPTTHITHLHNFLPYLTISSILQYSINNADQYDSYYPPRQSNFEALRVFPPYQSCITWQSYKSWESIMAKMVVCVRPFAKGTRGWQVARNHRRMIFVTSVSSSASVILLVGKTHLCKVWFKKYDLSF